MHVRPSLLILPLALALLTLAPSRARASPAYRGGAVATAHARATRAGLAMLERGGNAVDAAVAAAFVLAVVGPYHSSIGGGGFALWHQATRPGRPSRTRALDFREVAPRAASRDMFLREGRPDPALSREGALSVAVPGSIAGLLALHAEGGKLSRAQVLAPAIQAARDGFPVTPVYRRYATERLECLRADPEATRLFLRPDSAGQAAVPEVGTLLRQPDLARTLQTVASRGAAGFYEGRIAGALVAALKHGGGVLTEEDLRGYRSRWRDPLEGSYRGHRILTFPPPSAGGVTLLQALGILETLRPEGFAFHDASVLHLMTEALRRSFAERGRFMGDPAFADIPLRYLLSQEHLRALAKGIDPARATASAGLPIPNAEKSPPPPGDQKHTTHLSVVDRDGDAVALTSTNNYLFGACLVAPGTGILLNDEMDDFAAAPLAPNTYGLVGGEANAIAPGKIPLSSMTPTFVFQKGRPDQVRLVVGSPGGSTIPTTVLQVISNVLDAGMDVDRAVGAGRIHHQYLPDEIWVERWSAEPETLRALEAKGHRLAPHGALGLAHAVAVDPETGLRSAAADPRTEGLALGQD